MTFWKKTIIREKWHLLSDCIVNGLWIKRGVYIFLKLTVRSKVFHWLHNKYKRKVCSFLASSRFLRCFRLENFFSLFKLQISQSLPSIVAFAAFSLIKKGKEFRYKIVVEVYAPYERYNIYYFPFKKNLMQDHAGNLHIIIIIDKCIIDKLNPPMSIIRFPRDLFKLFSNKDYCG